MGSGHGFCGLDLNQYVATLMQTLHEQWSTMFYLAKVKVFFDVYVKSAFLLTSTIQFYVLKLFDYQGILCVCVIRNVG
jgi:hypothetical protein